MGHPNDGRLEAKTLRLRGRGLLKLLCGDHASDNATFIEARDVMQTARRARTSVSEPADDHVTAFAHSADDILSGDFGVRCLCKTLCA